MEPHVEKPLSPDVSVAAREPALRKAAVGLTQNHPVHSVLSSFLFFPFSFSPFPSLGEGRRRDVPVRVFFLGRFTGAASGLVCVDTEPDCRSGS